MNRMLIKTLPWLGALLLLACLVYGPSLHAQYFEDDFLFLFDGSCRDFARPFLHKYPTGWYRPLEAALLTCIQRHFQMNTVPIHVVAISVHAGLSYLVYVVVLRLGVPRLAAMLASALMVVSQANVAAVLGNDTLSQIAGTAFGCCSVWLLYLALHRGCSERQSKAATLWQLAASPRFLASLATFTLALLSKETSMSFLLLNGATIFVHYRRLCPAERRPGRVVATLFPYVVLAAVYMAVRSWLGIAHLAFGPGRYNVDLGSNVVRNLTMLFTAMLIPVSTVSTFAALNLGRSVLFLVMSSTAILVLVGLIAGLLRSGRAQTAVVIGILTVLALVPMILLNRVSELYAYNAMPFMSLLVALSLSGFIEREKMRPAVAVVIGVVLASHIVATRAKAALMRENGQRAAALLERIDTFISTVPPNGELLLVNPDDGAPRYSNFLMPGFDVLRYGERTIARAAHREDIRVRIVSPRDLKQQHGGGAVILSLKGGTVRTGLP
jgi:hypothetical protein